MKNIRLIALGVALATGTAMTIATPALAKKEESAQAAAPKVKPSAAFAKAAEPARKAISEKKYTEAGPLLEAAVPSATTADDKYLLGSLQVAQGAGTNSEAVMETGMKNVVDSGLAGPEETSKYNANLGIFAHQRNDFDSAIRYYETARAAGNTTILTNLAEGYYAKKDSVKAIDTINTAIQAKLAGGESPPEGWYKRANAFAIGSGDPALIASAMGNWLNAYPTPDNWRAVLVNYRDSANLNSSGLIDTYRLMRQVGALKGERDYVEFSDELFKSGQYAEASAVIEEGFGKGDVPASSQPGRDLRGLIGPRLAGDKTSLVNEAKAVNSMGAGPATKIANAFLSHGDYVEAERLYNVAAGKPGADMDDINTKLGILNVLNNNTDAAKGYFAKVQTAPRSGIAQFWLTYLNKK